MRTVIRAGLALTVDDQLGTVTDPVVVVDDGRITEIGRRGEVAEPADAEVVDLPDRWLLPGFVNAHTHAAMTLLRGYADDLPLQRWLTERIWPVEAHLSDDDIHAGARLACAEMVTAGVTTFADMYVAMDAVAAGVTEVGSRAVLGSGIFEAFTTMSAALDEAVRFARAWEGGANGRITTQLAPHAPYTCPPEWLVEVADAARELGVGTHIHLSETREELDRARQRWGTSPVAAAADAGLLGQRCLAAHCVWLDPADIALLRDARVGVAHCPRSNTKLASGVAPVADLLAAGVTVGLCTDGAASANQLTMFEEMRHASLLQKVTREDPTALPAATTLRTATLGGAHAVGLGDEIGSLTPGKRADLLALRLDRPGLRPLHDPVSTVVYAAQDRDVERVWVDGVEVARDGTTTRVDADAVCADVDRRVGELLARAGG